MNDPAVTELEELHTNYIVTLDKMVLVNYGRESRIILTLHAF